MRRLLNRVHGMLYDSDTGVHDDISRFPSVSSELEHQLQNWRNALPETLWFPEDADPVEDQYQYYLRQRFLSCRSVIYRPYLVLVLAVPPFNSLNDSTVIECCQRGLEACLLHIAHLREFPHTVMVDTWPCALS